MSLFRVYDPVEQRKMVANRDDRAYWPEPFPPYCVHIADWVWVCERNQAEAMERELRGKRVRSGNPGPVQSMDRNIQFRAR